MGIIKGGDQDETLDHLSISGRPVLWLFGAPDSEPAVHMSDASSNMNRMQQLDSMSPADVAIDDNDSGGLIDAVVPFDDQLIEDMDGQVLGDMNTGEIMQFPAG